MIGHKIDRLLVADMKHHAEMGVYEGQQITPYLNHAKRIHQETGTCLLFTRDVGYHTSGFLKNPDYERCYHLSISFWDSLRLVPCPRPFEPKLARLWVKAFFCDSSRFIWEESQRRDNPSEVRHYRVFCDLSWQPILPRKEVYSKEFTEAGWKSWSDIHEEKP